MNIAGATAPSAVLDPITVEVIGIATITSKPGTFDAYRAR